MKDIAKSYRHQRLFDEMLDRFKLNARSICDASGISEVMLSRFRNCNNDISGAKFVSLVQHIPQPAKNWYISQLFGAPPIDNVRSSVENLSPKERAELLRVIADLYVGNTRETTDTENSVEAV